MCTDSTHTNKINITNVNVKADTFDCTICQDILKDPIIIYRLCMCIQSKSVSLDYGKKKYKLSIKMKNVKNSKGVYVMVSGLV